MEINALNSSISANSEPKNGDGIPLSKLSNHIGRPKGSSNLHSKHPSSIANRLKKAGIDWIADLAVAIRTNNEARIGMWMKMLPYLIVTQGHRKVKRGKGRASKAALEALETMERGDE